MGLQGCLLKLAAQGGKLDRVFDVPGEKDDPSRVDLPNERSCFPVQGLPWKTAHEKLSDHPVEFREFERGIQESSPYRENTPHSMFIRIRWWIVAG
jgi:hypothetical protein